MTFGHRIVADAIIKATAHCEVRSCFMAAKLVDIQALLGHSTLNTIQLYSHVGQERMEQVVGRL